VPIKVLIVDDSSHIRLAVRSRIEEITDWEVCGEAENGRVAVEMIKVLSPDLVILDCSMPVMNGFAAAQEIKTIAPRAQMVLFTFHRFALLTECAQRVGISAVVPKDDAESLERLISTLSALIDEHYM
jgi:DNA-binding NarL/FixJ family response regulator